MKGLVALGALCELQSAGVLEGCTDVSGTSIGSLLAAAVALELDMEAVKEAALEHRFQPTYDFARFGSTFGIETGESVREFIHKVVPPALTFRDAPKKLKIVTTNLTRRTMTVFSRETHPDMSIARAIQLSCCVPFYFVAQEHEGDVYVDGALVDNFPLAACDTRPDETLGLLLLSSVSPRPPATPKTLHQYVAAIVDTVIQRQLPPDSKRYRILELHCEGVNAFEFTTNINRRKKLIKQGKQQAAEFVLRLRKNE